MQPTEQRLPHMIKLTLCEHLLQDLASARLLLLPLHVITVASASMLTLLNCPLIPEDATARTLSAPAYTAVQPAHLRCSIVHNTCMGSG